MANKLNDITKTGAQNWSQLQDANNDPFAKVRPQIISQYDINANREQLVASPLSRGNTRWGESMFDNSTATEYELENLGDVRAENQPWYAKIGAGFAKGPVLAGTIFLDGTIGLVTGAYSAIKEGKFSKVWDNDFSRAMKSVNDAMENIAPNYYTQEELTGPWYENIFTANFLGDKLIKNLGFAVGALYSGSIWTKPLTLGGKLAKTIGLVAKTSKAPTAVNILVGGGISAFNEGRVEALNNSTDWYNATEMQLREKRDARIQELIELYGDDADQYIAKEQEAYEEALAKANEDRAKMGNMDLLMNLPILMASNILQFSKFFANGYKTARKVGNIIGKPGEYTAKTTKRGAAWAVTKNSLAEGTEEISQKAASLISGDYYATDVNNFYKAKIDPKAEQETLSWMKAAAQGINETVNDGSSWEEFFIGTLTGALGIPVFKKKASGNYGVGLAGGIYNGYQEYMQQREREQTVANYMNNRVQSPEFRNYYQGLIRHNKYQADMNDAVDRGDEFDYKNAEHAQMVSDITMFDNGHKLNDLKTLIEGAYDTSDENLDAIVRNTTSITSVDGDTQLAGPFAQYAQLDKETGEIITNFGTEQDKQDMINKLTQTKDSIMNTIEDYIKIKDNLDIRTGERLTDDQLEELTWMQSQLNNWAARAVTMAGEVKQAIGSVIGTLSQFISFNEKIRAQEGLHTGNLSSLYLKADKDISRATQITAVLDAVRSLGDESFAVTLSSNPAFVGDLITSINNLPEDTMGQSSKEDIMAKLEDIIRLGKASKTYESKLKEYLENPSTQKEHLEKAEEQVIEERSQAAKSTIAQRFDWDKPISEIAHTLEENMEDIESNGGLDAFIDSLSSEQQDKVRKANNYKKGVNSLKRVIKDSDMNDFQKGIADQLIDDTSANVDSIEELGDKLAAALDNGEIGESILEALNDTADLGVNDLAIEELIEKTEASLRETLDTNLPRISNALKEIEELNKNKEKAAKAVDEGDLAEKTAEALGELEEEEPDLAAPSEGLITHEGPDILETPLTTAAQVKRTNKNTNEKVAGSIQAGNSSSKYNSRPQLTQVYLHGLDMQTYSDYIEKHPNSIPKGAKKADYIKYITATHAYLKEAGAFQYVSHSLKIGDDIEFTIDESLNTEAGVTVILIKSGDQIVGSLPTELEWGTKDRRNTQQTLAESRPDTKALYDNIIKEYNEWKKGDKSEPFSSGKTVVSALMGGTLALSNRESTVSEIFEGTQQVPIIAVANKDGSLSRFKDKSLDDPIIEPATAIQGQVYVMIPTNKGSLLPALAYGTPLAQLSQDDWYMQQIINSIKEIPKNLRTITDASHELYKKMRIPGLSVKVGYKAGKKWSSTNDLTEATHLIITYSNPKNPDKPKEQLIPLNNGELVDGSIWKAISSIIKDYPKTTTSVDITKLGDSAKEQEYRRNIARYLSTNLVRGQAHSVNDWFTFKPLPAQKKELVKEQLNNQKPSSEKSKKPLNKDLINDEAIEVTSLGETIPGILESSSKEKGKDDLSVFNRSASSKSSESGSSSTFSIRQTSSKVGQGRRGRRGKLLETTRTEDSNAARNQIAQDIRNIRKAFPQLSKDHAIVVVKGLIKTVNEKGDPVEAYGEFRDGILYISDHSPIGTAFHEAFHYITDMLMTPEERDLMFKAAKDKYGNLPQIELEERLAEDFRNYMNGFQGISGKLRAMYQRLKQIINALLDNVNYLDNLFYSIYNNEFAKRVPTNKKATSESKFLEVNRVEMGQIKAEAIKNGTFMKAPNGKPTNLTESQWLQVRTKNFLNWFGDWMNDPKNASKVVDENGEPLVVYHFSKEQFDEFSYDYVEDADSGFFFSTDRNYAKQYGIEEYSVFLNIRKPINTNIPLHRSNLTTIYREAFKSNDKTFDGIIGNDLLEDSLVPSEGWELMAYRPNQIKSATDNVGTFLKEDNSIYDDDFKKQLLEYKDKKLTYDNLDAETKNYLEERGISKEDYENLSIEAKEDTLQCML